MLSCPSMATDPPPKTAPARPVARPPVVGRPNGLVTPGAPGVNAQGRTGFANGAVGGSPRDQLMQSVRPAFPTAVVKPNLHTGPSRTAFEKPDNIRHNPEHRVGHFGQMHRHAPFMFARGGHPFYRRYYIRDGVWFWYDAPVLAGDPDYPVGVEGLPICDLNADECQGDIQPVAASPPDDPAFAPSDPMPDR